MIIISYYSHERQVGQEENAEKTTQEKKDEEVIFFHGASDACACHSGRKYHVNQQMCISLIMSFYMYGNSSSGGLVSAGSLLPLEVLSSCIEICNQVRK